MDANPVPSFVLTPARTRTYDTTTGKFVSVPTSRLPAFRPVPCLFSGESIWSGCASWRLSLRYFHRRLSTSHILGRFLFVKEGQNGLIKAPHFPIIISTNIHGFQLFQHAWAWAWAVHFVAFTGIFYGLCYRLRSSVVRRRLLKLSFFNHIVSSLQCALRKEHDFSLDLDCCPSVAVKVSDMTPRKAFYYLLRNFCHDLVDIAVNVSFQPPFAAFLEKIFKVNSQRLVSKQNIPYEWPRFKRSGGTMFVDMRCVCFVKDRVPALDPL